MPETLLNLWNRVAECRELAKTCRDPELKREILAKKKKALVIYGLGHFAADGENETIRKLIEKTHPGSIFFISPYIGFNQKDCSEEFEQTATKWPLPALVTGVRGTMLESHLSRSGCDSVMGVPPDASDALRQKLDDLMSGRTSDGLLYLGPAHTLMRGPRTSDFYLDPEYRREIDPRSVTLAGRPIPEAPELITPKRLRVYD